MIVNILNIVVWGLLALNIPMIVREYKVAEMNNTHMFHSTKVKLWCLIFFFMLVKMTPFILS